MSKESDALFNEMARIVIEEYRKALKNPYVRRPVAYALYEAWRKIDEKKQDRKLQSGRDDDRG